MTENLQNIMREIDRVQKRMQGLLNFAKPLEPQPVSVEVNALVRGAVETMRSRFRDAGVSPNMDLVAGLPNITFDLNHLEQALMGLITNALEATAQGGVVTIRTRSSIQNGDKGVVRIFIEDNGVGIPRENRARIFEPFFTTKPHGTGIGLPLAKKFIEINGGKITIQDDSQLGTKVEVTLPVAT